MAVARFPAGGVGPGMGPDDEIRQVRPEAWMDEVSRARAEGYTWFDSLHAVDELGRPGPDGVENLRVLCRLVNWGPDGPSGVQVHTRIPRDQPGLASLNQLIAGASWHEREAHDLFGITFHGGDDSPLIFHQPTGVAPLRPLRKDAVLAARVTRAWPGAKDPDTDSTPDAAQASRRRMAPAGVPDPEVWGQRAPGDQPDPHEVVQSLQGGRVRRRR